MDKTYRRYVREQAIVEHVARKLYEPKPEQGRYHLSATTDTGLSIEEQIRKSWDPSKGGLPNFLV